MALAIKKVRLYFGARGVEATFCTKTAKIEETSKDSNVEPAKHDLFGQATYPTGKFSARSLH